MDTDMTKGYDLKKTSPATLPRALAALEAGKEEILADESTKGTKQSLSGERAYYLDALGSLDACTLYV